MIQPHRLHLGGVPNPTLDSGTKDCCNYVFCGSCNAMCARRRPHTPPTSDRKHNLLAFRGQCLCRYDSAKGLDDPDFC